MTLAFSETFDSFAGSGFDSLPAAGQLDSDLWRVTGLSDGDGAFGGTFTAGDFARGNDLDGGVSTGGVYAFDIAGEVILGIQAGGSDFTPGAITLRLTNDTGSMVDAVDLSYNLWWNNGQPRANSLNFAFSTDDVSYRGVPALDFTSPELTDALGSQSTIRMATLTGLGLAPGESLYLQWQGDDVSGGGARDEFGIDDISVSVPTTARPTLINEVVVSTTSSDVEFAEIIGEPGASLDGLTLVNIESDDASGNIDSRFDIPAGTVIPADGFLVIGNDLLAAATGVTPDILIPQNFFENSSSTIALLETATITGSTVDGTETAIDALGLSDGTADTFYYGAPVLGPDGSFYPSGAERVPNGGTFVLQDVFSPAAAGSTPGASNGSGAVLTIADAAIAEGDAGTTTLNFNVTLSGTASAFTVDYATADGTATAGPDYTAVADTLSFDGTDGEVQSFTVDIAGDTDPEPDEVFTVLLSGLTGTEVSLADDSATGTIANDDGLVVTPISAVQGVGDAGSLAGTSVTVEAIVTADFQDSADSDYNGFFLLEEDADRDADPMTSEGLFVFEGANMVDVAVGDRVQVTGTVTEFNGETQISSVTAVSVLESGVGAGASPAVVTFPATGVTTNADGEIIADLEAYEGMLVTVPEALTVGDLFTLGRYNEVGLTSGGRIHNFTQTNEPSVSGFAAFQQEAASRGLVIDDTFENAQNLDPIFPAPGLDADIGNVIRSGDTVENLTGVVAYRGARSEGESFRVVPTEAPVFQSTNPRPTEAPDVGSDFTVASFNVLNFFESIDTNAGGFNGPNITGPAGDQEPRGAEFEEPFLTTDPDGLTEFDRQLAKLVEAISEIAADVVGLVEIENGPVGMGDIALETLTDALNAASGGAFIYDYVATGAIEGAMGGDVEGDAIKVGFLYNTETVALAGGYAILDETIDPRFETVGTQRPALAQTFTEIASGESFTAVVNHFKSKGSVADYDDDGDPATPKVPDAGIGDGQANNPNIRANAAEALVDWLATDPTGSGDEDHLILGDLNAYLMEDALQAILDGADDIRDTADDYVSRIGTDDYSFGFPVDLDLVPQVQTFGTLDYALANLPLDAQITGVAEWHINADEAGVLDYNLNFKPENQQLSLFALDPFRASDHDPLIVGLDLGGDGEPVFESVSLGFERDGFLPTLVYRENGAVAAEVTQFPLLAVRDPADLLPISFEALDSADSGRGFFTRFFSNLEDRTRVTSDPGVAIVDGDDGFNRGLRGSIDGDERLAIEIAADAAFDFADSAEIRLGGIGADEQAAADAWLDGALVGSFLSDGASIDIAASFDRLEISAVGDATFTVQGVSLADVFADDPLV